MSATSSRAARSAPARRCSSTDVDAGRILEGRATLDELGREVYEVVLAAARGTATKSEALGHQEFILTYKAFEHTNEPAGPACLPVAA